jgi:hypothetical protein
LDDLAALVETAYLLPKTEGITLSETAELKVLS